MRFGTPFSAALGAPDHAVEYFQPAVAADGSGVLVRFRPRAGYGDAFFGLYLNAARVAHVFVAEGRETEARVPLPWGAELSSLLLLRLGHFGDPYCDYARVARTFETVENTRVTLQFRFVPEITGAVGENGRTDRKSVV